MGKVMVLFSDEVEPIVDGFAPPQSLTYEIAGEVSVGDRVRAPYGNYNPEVRNGIVVAIGSLPKRWPNGHTEPAYAGYCKTATVIQPE